jgi:hypothetical protein
VLAIEPWPSTGFQAGRRLPRRLPALWFAHTTKDANLHGKNPLKISGASEFNTMQMALPVPVTQW